jgi:hypothetical protein
LVSGTLLGLTSSTVTGAGGRSFFSGALLQAASEVKISRLAETARIAVVVLRMQSTPMGVRGLNWEFSKAQWSSMSLRNSLAA